MKNQNYYLHLFLLVIVFVSRLPFIEFGYGSEEDSWGLALAAYHTHLTGVFETSRMPGHPLQELVLSLCWGAPVWVFNLFSVLMSVLAAHFFYLILRELNSPFTFWASFAFAFTPVVFVSSTYTIDYMWALAFCLGSFYFLLRQNLVLVAVFIALASACRLTYLVLLLPYSYYIFDATARANSLKTIARTCSLVFVFICILYLPIFYVYGFSIFEYWDLFEPSLPKLLYKASFGVFGFMGTIAVLIAICILIFNMRSIQNVLKGKVKKFTYMTILLLIIFVLLYLKLPQKSAYLLPVVPFLILVFSLFLSEQNFTFLSICLIVSSFTGSINLTDKYRGASFSKNAITATISGQEIFFDVFTGPVESDLSKRKQKINYVEKVLDNSAKLRTNMLIISGWWYNQIMVQKMDRPNYKYAHFIDYANEDSLKFYRHNNYMIFYLPEQNVNNDKIYNLKTEDFAYPFLIAD